MSLTPFNPKFASLSKFNPGHAKFFDLGFFLLFSSISFFLSPFPSQTQVKGRFYPCALSLWPVGEEQRMEARLTSPFFASVCSLREGGVVVHPPPPPGSTLPNSWPTPPQLLAGVLPSTGALPSVGALPSAARPHVAGILDA
jgi:hypothetical protein